MAARRGRVRPSRRRPRVGGLARVVDTRTGLGAALDRGPGRIAARPAGRAAQFARHAMGHRRGLHGDARRPGRRGTGGAGRARPAVGRAPRGRRPRNRPSAGVRGSRGRARRPGAAPAAATRAARSGTSLSGTSAGCGRRRAYGRRCLARLGDRKRWEQAEGRDDRASDRRLTPDRRGRGDPLVASASTRSIRARRRVAGANAGNDGRAPRGGAWRPDTGDCVPARRRAVRRRLGSRCRAATRPRPRRHRYHGGRQRGGRARSRSRVARRTGARRVRPRHCRARPRNRATRRRGAVTAGRSSGVTRTHRVRRRRRTSPDRAQLARWRTAAASDLVGRARARGVPGRLGRDDRGSLARARRGRAGNHRATRPRARNSSDSPPRRRAPDCRRSARATRVDTGDRPRRRTRSTAGFDRARRLLRRLGGAHQRDEACVADARHR